MARQSEFLNIDDVQCLMEIVIIDFLRVIELCMASVSISLRNSSLDEKIRYVIIYNRQ